VVAGRGVEKALVFAFVIEMRRKHGQEAVSCGEQGLVVVRAGRELCSAGQFEEFLVFSVTVLRVHGQTLRLL
jgi:hypothetical protein